MRSFLEKNSSIAAAIILPILFAGFFYVSKTIVSEKGVKPQHDLIVISSNRNNDHFDLQVIDGEVVLNFIYPVANKDGKITYRVHNNQKPELYYIKADTLIAEPIGYLLPKDAANPPQEKQGMSVRIPIKTLSELSISAAKVSPDGFKFSVSRYSDGNIMTELYQGGNRREPRWVLKKDANIHRVQGVEDSRYRYGFEQFGWVLKD